jgi:hypothetical protein
VLCLQVFARCYVVREVNISMESVSVTPVGRAKSAVYATTNAKCLTATVMVIAPTASALASEDTRASSAKKVRIKDVFFFYSFHTFTAQNLSIFLTTKECIS